jgi:hypothetical protein
VGDKPGKYWDYNECRWVKCPTSADDVSVPAQQDVEAVTADDETVVGTSI